MGSSPGAPSQGVSTDKANTTGIFSSLSSCCQLHCLPGLTYSELLWFEWATLTWRAAAGCSRTEALAAGASGQETPPVPWRGGRCHPGSSAPHCARSLSASHLATQRQTKWAGKVEAPGVWGLQPRALNFKRKFTEWKTFTRTACAAS